MTTEQKNQKHKRTLIMKKEQESPLDNCVEARQLHSFLTQLLHSNATSKPNLNEALRLCESLRIAILARLE